MIDINLHKASENDLKISRRKSIFRSGFFLSVALLAVVSVIFGITKLYQNNLINKKNSLVQLRADKLNSFDNNTVNNLVNFKRRLDGVSFNLQNKDNPGEVLNSVENLIVKGASLNDLDYDIMNNSLKMEVVADSFRLASNQMLSLKKSDLFRDVLIDDSYRNEAGQAVFTLTGVLKNETKINKR